MIVDRLNPQSVAASRQGHQSAALSHWAVEHGQAASPGALMVALRKPAKAPGLCKASSNCKPDGEHSFREAIRTVCCQREIFLVATNYPG